MSQLIAVEVLFHDRRLKEYVFDKDCITVGRDPTSDVHLDNVGVSRLHAKIERQGEAIRLADCGSANGSLVNLMRVSEAKLGPEDAVQIGKFTLKVRPRQDVRGGRSSDENDGPQLPERDTIRAGDVIPRVSTSPSYEANSGSNPRQGKAIVFAVLFGAGVLAGWLISRL